MSLGQAESPANRAVDGSVVPVQQRRDFATRFQPGNRANPTGRPRTAYFRKRALQTLRQLVAEGCDRGNVVMDTIVTQAEKGSLDAATFLRDTVDGPVTANANQNNIGVAVTVEFAGEQE